MHKYRNIWPSSKHFYAVLKISISSYGTSSGADQCQAEPRSMQQLKYALKSIYISKKYILKAFLSIYVDLCACMYTHSAVFMNVCMYVRMHVHT